MPFRGQVLAVGIEGSDYSSVRARAGWATIPHRLFTADVTEPFEVVAAANDEASKPLKFSVITAWEFIEHIHRDKLPGVFRNIDAHLKPDGVVSRPRLFEMPCTAEGGCATFASCLEYVLDAPCLCGISPFRDTPG